MNESITYAEVYEILNLLGEKYINKIPKKLYDFINSSRNKNVDIKYSIDVPIENQNISNDAIEIISLLNLKYWSSKEEQSKLMKIYNSNELKYQEEIKEKYSIDKIFENRKRNKEETNKDSEYINEKEENVALIEFKENIILKIIKKIKSLFKKKK